MSTQIKTAFLATLLAGLMTACGGDQGQSHQQQRTIARTGLQAANPIVRLEQERASWTWSSTANGLLFTNSLIPAISQTLPATTRRLRFADVSLALDTDGIAGKIFRLYQAAFGRTPDLAGLGYWIGIMDGGQTLVQIAEGFIRSPEFASLYGTNPDDAEFITRLYANVLHRTPDAGGLNYWLDSLRQSTSRAEMLVSFADSAENQAAVLPAIKNGIAYAEFGVAYHPVANAGTPQATTTGTPISLDGSASSDTNNDTLSYSWRINKAPAGSAASLSAGTSAKPSFQPDLVGQYEFSLTVSDGVLTSARSVTVSLSVSAPLVVAVPDSGIYKCATLSVETARALFAAGHTYLDRDNDGKPCEANDVRVELASTPPIITPPVVTPPVVLPPSNNTGMCWVNGYRRKNGTWVNGYYRRC